MCLWCLLFLRETRQFSPSLHIPVNVQLNEILVECIEEIWRQMPHTKGARAQWWGRVLWTMLPLPYKQFSLDYLIKVNGCHATCGPLLCQMWSRAINTHMPMIIAKAWCIILLENLWSPVGLNGNFLYYPGCIVLGVDPSTWFKIMGLSHQFMQPLTLLALIWVKSTPTSKK